MEVGGHWIHTNLCIPVKRLLENSELRRMDNLIKQSLNKIS